MKLRRLALWLLVLPPLLLLACSHAAAFPDPVGYVNDFAGLLSPQTRQDLEARLVALEEETSCELAVVTVASLDGMTVEDYAAGLFQKWGIGKKDKDNGVLFIIARDEREVRIEVGYGLETTLTDSRAGRILDDYVVPKLRNNDWEGGILGAVAGIEPYLGGGSLPAPTPADQGDDGIGGHLGAIALYGVGMILLLYLIAYMQRTKSFWLGGVVGALAGGVGGFWVIGGWLPGLIALVALGGAGTLFDFALSRAYQARRAAGRDGKWHQTGGGFWGMGLSGGRGGGGFGGGRSGGGGGSRGF